MTYATFSHTSDWPRRVIFFSNWDSHKGCLSPKQSRGGSVPNSSFTAPKNLGVDTGFCSAKLRNAPGCCPYTLPRCELIYSKCKKLPTSVCLSKNCSIRRTHIPFPSALTKQTRIYYLNLVADRLHHVIDGKGCNRCTSEGLDISKSTNKKSVSIKAIVQRQN